MVSKTHSHDKRGDEFWYIRTLKGSRLFYDKKYGSTKKAEEAADEFINEYVKNIQKNEEEQVNSRLSQLKEIAQEFVESLEPLIKKGELWLLIGLHLCL